MAQGFEVLPVFTIWVKVRAGLSDILHHAVGEMTRRVRGGSLAPSIWDIDASWEPAGAPLMGVFWLVVAGWAWSR